MADDKSGREKQARDADNRQRRRDVDAALERGNEPEPAIDDDVLGDVESELERLAFPAKGADIAAELGDREVKSAAGRYRIADLVPETEAEAFDSPGEVRERIARPTVATAMKRIVEAGASLSTSEFGTSQRDAYERTFRELAAIDAVDEDEGIRAVADWVVEQLTETEKLPGSRAVRRQAAKYCRANGYEVRNDEWLGV